MRRSLALARRGYGTVSPNPMVGAMLVSKGEIIGRGWHRKAGMPHAEIDALRDARKRGNSTRGSTLYVTLEPCCTHGRTPPCTDAILAAGIKRVVIGATDPNPKHAGRAFGLLKNAGVKITSGVLAEECARLNEAFNHWIVHGTPFITVKAAMTLDGKIATPDGQSKWITGEKARAEGMRLRRGSDSILVGINTILADDPSLTLRGTAAAGRQDQPLKRIILDTLGRTPLSAKVVCDQFAGATTIVVGPDVSKGKLAKLQAKVRVVVAPTSKSTEGSARINLRWLTKFLGREDVTSMLIEGGGEANAAFIEQGLAHRVAFFYAPKILGGRNARRGIAGTGAADWNGMTRLDSVEWQRLGDDLYMTARIAANPRHKK